MFIYDTYNLDLDSGKVNVAWFLVLGLFLLISNVWHNQSQFAEIGLESLILKPLYRVASTKPGEHWTWMNELLTERLFILRMNQTLI